MKLFSDLLQLHISLAIKTVWEQDSRVTHEADDGNRLYRVTGTEPVIRGDDDVL